MQVLYLPGFASGPSSTKAIAYADHFAARGIEVSIARPDFYVFGTAASLGELGALVDDLAARLRVPVIA